MLSLSKHLFVSLAVMVLGFSQVFGLMTGYECDCTGEVRLVTTTACEPMACHPDLPHSNHGECSHESHHEQGIPHKEVKQDLTALGSQGPVITPMVPVAILNDSFFQLLDILVTQETKHLTQHLFGETNESPPTPLIVVKTTVLRV